jgi:protein-disulfide isomerase
VVAALASAAALAPGTAPAQVEVAVDPAMIRGQAQAPVTILEFSDYQ